MEATGTLIVRVFVSRAQLPISNATVTVYSPGMNHRMHLHYILTTDGSGVSGPVKLPATDSFGLTPSSPVPYSSYDLVVEHPDYQLGIYRHLQIFRGVQTIQDVQLIPLIEIGGSTEDISTVTPQPL